MKIEDVTKKYMAETKNLKGETLQRKCLEWMFEPLIWKTFYPMSFPPKTKQVLEHEQISKEERKKLDPQYYRDNPEILDYYGKKDAIISKNETNVNWLLDMKVYCKNVEELKKIKMKVAEFKKVLAKQYPTKYAQLDPTVKRYEEEFEGQVIR